MPFSPARLRAHRDGQHLTLREVSERAGLHITDVMAFESGRTTPEIHQIMELARVLAVTDKELEVIHENQEDDYVSAVVRYLMPLSQDDVDGAAAAIVRAGAQ